MKLAGWQERSQDNQVKVTCVSSQAEVRISGDTALSQVVLYAESRAVCPEMTIQIDLAPAHEQRWQTRYEMICAERH